MFYDGKCYFNGYFYRRTSFTPFLKLRNENRKLRGVAKKPERVFRRRKSVMIMRATVMAAIILVKRQKRGRVQKSKRKRRLPKSWISLPRRRKSPKNMPTNQCTSLAQRRRSILPKSTRRRNNGLPLPRSTRRLPLVTNRRRSVKAGNCLIDF